MGFGFAGAAGGAADALRQLQQDQAAREEQALRAKVLMQQLGASQAAEQRATRDQQLQEAGIALQQADAMQPGAELSPELVKLITGTPYEARVQTQGTLPSKTRTIDFANGTMQTTADPGGRTFSVLRPTAAQARERQQLAALDAAANDSTLPATVRRVVSLHRIGVNIANPESLETPEERRAREQGRTDAAFGDFKRRTDYETGVREAAAKRARADAATAPITRGDRLHAMQLADEAASRYINAIGTELQPVDNALAEAIRQQFRDEYLQQVGAGPAIDLRAAATPTQRRLISSIVRRGNAGGSQPPPATDAYAQYLQRTGAR